MMSAPRSASIAATVLLPEPMPPVRPMTGRAAMRAVGSAIVPASRGAAWGAPGAGAASGAVRCTSRVPARVLEMKLALPYGGEVFAGVALAAGHRAGRSPVVVLAPGAGSDRHHPSLAGIQTGLAAAGWTTVTFDFPYREAGRRVPDPPPPLAGRWGAGLA